MGVLVLVLQVELVRVRVRVAISAVAVLVSVLDMLVRVLGVHMGVDRVLVAVLVGVRARVGVFVGHQDSPLFVTRACSRAVACHYRGWRRCGREVPDVPERLVQERGYVWVMQRIDGSAARLSASHQAKITQDPQLV